MNNTEEKQKIMSFTDLNAWKEGHELVLMIYPPSQKTSNVSLRMNAKNFLLRRDSAPDEGEYHIVPPEARGEDTPSVSSRELHKLTVTFPEKEKFGLVSQMERAVVSYTSNVAEGFTRLGKKDKMNFYYMAKSSLTELQNQLLICKDLGYINNENFNLIWNQTIMVHKLITGLIKGVSRLKK